MSKSVRQRARQAYQAGLRHLSSSQKKFAKTAFNALRRQGHDMAKAVEHALAGASGMRPGESPKGALRRLLSSTGHTVEKRGHRAIDQFVGSTGKKLLHQGVAKIEAFVHDKINKSNSPSFVKNMAKRVVSNQAAKAKRHLADVGSKRAKSALSGVVKSVFGRGGRKRGGRKRGGGGRPPVHMARRGPVVRAGGDGFFSIDRRSGRTVPRRLTMHRQNVHTV